MASQATILSLGRYAKNTALQFILYHGSKALKIQASRGDVVLLESWDCR